MQFLTRLNHCASVCSEMVLVVKPHCSVCRFSESGHVEFEVKDFQHIQEGQSRGKIDLARLGFFIYPIELEGQLEVDLAQSKVGSPFDCKDLKTRITRPEPQISVDIYTYTDHDRNQC